MGRKGGFPGGGMGNMGAMMKQAQKMQVELARAQEEIKDMTFEASAGGGMVKAVAQGDTSLVSLTRRCAAWPSWAPSASTPQPAA